MASHSNFRRQSRKMALCGMMTALSAAVLSTGSLIPFATFAGPMLAMLCLLPILHDWGAKYALMVYAAAAVLALMLCADKELALFYAFLGWYPALRPRLAPLPRPLRAAAKAGLFALALTAMYALAWYVLRLEAAELSRYAAPMAAALLALGVGVCLAFDRALEVLTARYRQRRRPHGLS